MVGAHVDELRLAPAALLLPVFGRPLHHRPRRVGVGRTVEEVVRRRLVRLGAADRVGERRGVRGGVVGNLVLGHERAERLGVGGTPALDRDDLARHTLVGGNRSRHLVGDSRPFRLVELLAADAAFLVDVRDRVVDALAVGGADVGRRAAVVGDMTDRDALREAGGWPGGHRRKRRRRRTAPLRLAAANSFTLWPDLHPVMSIDTEQVDLVSSQYENGYSFQ